MNKKIGIILGFIIVAGLAFYGGDQYGLSQKPTNGQNGFSAGQRQGGQMGSRRMGMNGGGFASGDILSKDDKSIVIKLRNGGSQIIFYSPSTEIQKMGAATLSDLQTGKSVTVIGTANADGSVIAKTIQLRPNTPFSSSQ